MSTPLRIAATISHVGPWNPHQISCAFTDDVFAPSKAQAAFTEALISQRAAAGAHIYEGTTAGLAGLEVSPDALSLRLRRTLLSRRTPGTARGACVLRGAACGLPAARIGRRAGPAAVEFHERLSATSGTPRLMVVPAMSATLRTASCMELPSSAASCR